MLVRARTGITYRNVLYTSNDYSQHFVVSGKRPQNYIRDVHYKNRFDESTKLRELINLKVKGFFFNRFYIIIVHYLYSKIDNIIIS